MFNFKILIAAIAFIVFDYVYVKISRHYVSKQVVRVQKTQVKLDILGVVLRYVFMITALGYFIIAQQKPPSDAFLLGLLINGISEVSNYAIFSDWSMPMVILDTIMGGLLFAAATSVTYTA